MALGIGYAAQNCSLARALEIVGERWTMLVVRDLFYGVYRFTDLLAHLDISRAVLTDRLNALAAAGLVERRDGEGHPVYELTDAGVALWPSLFALWSWGRRFAGGDNRGRSFAHASCGTGLEGSGRCPRCSTVPGPAELLTLPPAGAGRSGRGDRVSVLLRRPHRLLTPLVPEAGEHDSDLS
jgi:DNA-binding HxlR family transcriptional regulator